ncbi:MAG: hypothetical protein CL846_04045 [Crocinitomicaceae bacterium]|nr:hypothetical protein [Crocinitomicaceae bacterium]
MKFLSKYLLLLILVFPFVNQSQLNPNPDATLDAYILNKMNEKNFPGLSSVVVKNGEIVWVESYGYADVENLVPVEDTTVFMLASVSKLFTGTAAMKLHENNTINIDENINDYLPWNLEIPGYANDTVTFRQLMTHTSSIKDNYAAMGNYYGYPDPTISLANCMERYFTINGVDYNSTSNFLNYLPGTYYKYSNMASALNGYLVEIASSTPFDQYCENNIFNPLCMNKTSWFFSDFDSAEVARPHQYQNGANVPINHYGFADYPNGQLRSNVMDLAKFMVTYLNGGVLDSYTLLSANTINDMWTLQVPNLNDKQGINWKKEVLFHDNGSSWLWGHSGSESGVSTYMYLDPVTNIGVCILANGSGGGITICDKLYNFALSPNINSGLNVECLLTNVEKPILSKLIYPNPVNDVLHIDGFQNNETIDVELYDLTGKLIKITQEKTINMHKYPKGIYLLKLKYENSIEFVKLVKE